MAIRLKDVPRENLSMSDAEALVDGEFDYADRERVSLKAAKVGYRKEAQAQIDRDGLMEVNKAFGSNHDIDFPSSGFGNLTDTMGEFTTKEKAFELTKAGQRGAGNIIKLPGIALKALGESVLSRSQIEEMKTTQPIRAKWLNSATGKTLRNGMDMLRRAGNKYTDSVNKFMIPESQESQMARQGSFMQAPVYRTLSATAESAPTYGLAIASSITTGNPNLGLYILGATTAGSAYEGLRANGVDPDLALIGSVLEGTIEIVTEKVPMDMLMKGAGRPFLVRALKLGTAESFQELFAQLGQNYVNAAVSEIDPKDYSTVMQAAQQEWSVISQGWQDAMAAGFLMGGGAAAFSSTQTQDLGFKTADEMKAEYGVAPRNDGEFLYMVDKIKQKVKAVTAEPEAKKIPVLGEQGVTVTPEQGIQAQATSKQEIGLETRPAITEEIGEGELKPRGTSVSVLAQAIEEGLVEENKTRYDDVPDYRVMNMTKQADKLDDKIETDIEQVKRWAFYKEVPPSGIYPENAFTALRTYVKQNPDVDLITELSLNEDAAREHTIMGKRIKSLDTDQDYTDPITAIREIVGARKEEAASKGVDASILETQLKDLQAQLTTAKQALATKTTNAVRAYGTKNTLVTRTVYDTIMARRKAEIAQLAHKGKSMGAVYVPTAQDFADIAQIATFHLEAMGRDFAKWSNQMQRDFGDWIKPYLADEYDKALKQAEDDGVTIKESKRLTTKKKRLITTTKKIKAKFQEQDFEKTPALPIELDEEGQRLQYEYDTARESFKAARAAFNLITEEEVHIISQLAKDATDRKVVMEKSVRRKEGEGATTEELEYGIAATLFLEYANDLKAVANKRSIGTTIKNYIANPVDFISDLAGTMKAAKASLDNSFHLRQGLPTFLKGITGDVQSAKIWWSTFSKSFKIMWSTLKKQKAMQMLSAEMISDPDYDLLKKSKVALHVIEEEIPIDLPSRIPIVGMLFRMGENAFVGSSRYMRYRLAKQYINIWRKSGVNLTKNELESIGRLANSQTGRGESSATGQTPGLMNNLFWSPRNLRAYVDILTIHSFDRNISKKAKRQATKNLLRYIIGAAMILKIAKWVDDDSVTFDANSSDFGKIKIGDSRFSVGGGMAVLVVLVHRLISREYTNSTTGQSISIDLKKWGAISGKDLIWNFTENKLSPAASLALTLVNNKTRDNGNLTVPQMVNDALTPLIIQNIFEAGDADDSANILAVLMAESLGVNVQTYVPKGKQKRKHRKSY